MSMAVPDRALKPDTCVFHRVASFMPVENTNADAGWGDEAGCQRAAGSLFSVSWGRGRGEGPPEPSPVLYCRWVALPVLLRAWPLPPAVSAAPPVHGEAMGRILPGRKCLFPEKLFPSR